MYLSRHLADGGARWALDGRYLPAAFTLDLLLELPAGDVPRLLGSLPLAGTAGDPLLPPVGPAQELWASGAAYESSCEARKAECTEADV